MAADLDPAVFDAAADYIDTNGWWGGDAIDRPADGELPCACVSNALAIAAGNGADGAPYQLMLCRFLEVASMDDVFALNDGHDADTGPVWSAAVLRCIAEVLRADQR